MNCSDNTRSMMKNIWLTAAIAALLMLVSCQKEEDTEKEIRIDPVFTARIDTTNVKTTLNALTGHITWETGDEVAIVDGVTPADTVMYEVSAIDNGCATLTKKAGETKTLGNGPYTAFYGELTTAQHYTGATPKMPMSAQSSSNNFVFTVSCGLLELTLTKAGESIRQIAVSDGSTTYTLNCSTPVSIATGQVFYLALPAGDYTVFTFKNAANGKCVKAKAGTKVTVTSNAIKPLSFAASLSFNLPEDAIPGVFSIAPDRTVLFSKGNLQYQAGTGTTAAPQWRFAANQYDFIGNNAGNNVTEDRDKQAGWIDLFGWSATGRTDINGYLQQPYVTTTGWANYRTLSAAASGEMLTRANGGDWGVCAGGDWRTLTSEEWTFLLGNTAPRTSSKHKLSTVTFAPDKSVYGLIIMPDNWSGTLNGTTDQSTWATLEAAGAVFLPAAGYRYDTTVNDNRCGYYWAANATEGSNHTAYQLFFNTSGTLRTSNGQERGHGCAVRLVTE